MAAAVVTGLACAWLAAIVAAPLLPGAVSALVYLSASVVCHQLPDRSFHVGAWQLPVCGRCLGIYAGAAVGAVAALGGLSLGSRRRIWAVTAAACVPTALTVALEWIGVWLPSNMARAFAGFPMGAVAAIVVTGALATVHYGECAQRRPTATSPPPPRI